jgi:hypothetical protein
MFNKYQFIEDLKKSIEEQKNEDDNFDSQSYIFEQLDNEVIYYYNCFEICIELNFTDFKNHELGEITNISTAAFCALYDLCIEEGIY